MQIPLSTIYITVSGLSFIILSLQIALTILFQVIAFSPILAISLTFLGLSTGGIFSYIKYSKEDLPLNIYIPAYLNISGILLLLYTIAIKWHSISILKKEKLLPRIYWNKKLLDIFNNSALISIGFVMLFFCLGVILSLIYKQHSNKAAKVYFFDLIGAACGCIFGTIIFNFLQLSSILILISLCSFLLAILATKGYGTIKIAKIPVNFLIFIAAFLLIINIKTNFLEPELNPNFLAKDWVMKQECKELWHSWNTYSRISLVESKQSTDHDWTYSFSINNAEGGFILTKFNQAPLFRPKLFTQFSAAQSAFLTGTTPQNILILFAGAGNDMLEAYYYSEGASDITGVELNPLIVNKALSLPKFHLKDFFAKKNVHMVIQEARSYLETTHKIFDTIIIPTTGASSAQYLGIPNYTGQYLFTKEAFKSYLKHLKPNGTIGIINISKIQLVAMVKEAFKEIGDDDLHSKIVIFDSKQSILNEQTKRELILYKGSSVALIKNSFFSKEEITTIGKNIRQMSMDWIYNPYYTQKGFEFIESLIKTKNTHNFLAKLKTRYNHNFVLSTDDKPFAYVVKKDLDSKHLILNMKSIFLNKVEAPISFNYLIFCFTMFLLAAGLLFIILPLAIKTKNTPKIIGTKLLFYFSILGLGFVSVEIGIMQIFTLFFGNPTYSFSIVLASLLISTGIGAFLSTHLFSKGYLNIRKNSLLSFFILLLYFFFLPKINTYLLFLIFFYKLLIAFALILPLGICLGMFFPQGLKQAQAQDKNLIPWAWGLNGYMSILGSVLSPYLALAAGFRSFFLVAAFLYLALIFINIRGE